MVLKEGGYVFEKIKFSKDISNQKRKNIDINLMKVYLLKTFISHLIIIKY